MKSLILIVALIIAGIAGISYFCWCGPTCNCAPCCCQEK